MDPEVKQETSTDFETPESGTMRKLSSSEQAQEQWQQLGEQASTFLKDLPGYISSFFSEYRQPIVTVGLVLAIFLTAKVAFAILGAINEVPLLAPTFEIIGIGYSAWFIYRYLLKASSRNELSNDFSSLKEQVLGQRDQIIDKFSTKD
ncbi:MAG: CAAD domain-containing protein [Cyanobacteria bacterium J06626_14]